MNAHEKDLFERLEAMPLTEARLAVARGEFGQAPDSPNYIFSSGVVAARESAARDAREEITLSIARKALSSSTRANIIAISAIIFSVITAAIIAWYTVKYGK